jgi:hypothetical protein
VSGGEKEVTERREVGGIDPAADPAGIGSERRNKSARPVFDETMREWCVSPGHSQLV